MLAVNHWLWGRAGKAWGRGQIRLYRLFVWLGRLTDPAPEEVQGDDAAE